VKRSYLPSSVAAILGVDSIPYLDDGRREPDRVIPEDAIITTDTVKPMTKRDRQRSKRKRLKAKGE